MEYRAERFISPKINRRETFGALSEALSSKVNSHIGFINQIFLLIIVSVAATRVITGDISQGVMAAIILLVNRYFSFLQQFIVYDQSKSLNERIIQSIRNIKNLERESVEESSVKSIDSLVIDQTSLERGRIYFLVGASGSGKSYLQKHLSQEIDQPSDRVSVNNISMKWVTSDFATTFVTRVNRNSRYVDGTIIDNLTCFDASKHNLCHYLSNEFGIRKTLDELPKGFYTELARTQRLPFSKKVSYLAAVIRATLCEPEILLLDDLDQSLTKKEIEQMAQALISQRRNQFTLIATKYHIEGPLFTSVNLRVQ